MQVRQHHIGREINVRMLLFDRADPSCRPLRGQFALSEAP